MTRLALLVAVLVASACSGEQSRPTGPAPEYERPELPPWDSGKPPEEDDPFADIAAGDWVDENPPEAAPDAGSGQAGDAGAPSEASPDAPELPRDSGVG